MNNGHDFEKLPSGTVYRQGTNPPTWRFSSRTERDPKQRMIALDPQRVQNEDRLEEFYQAWLAMRELANRLSIDVHIRPMMLAEQVEQELAETYERGIQEGSGNPNKYRPASNRYVWPEEG